MQIFFYPFPTMRETTPELWDKGSAPELGTIQFKSPQGDRADQFPGLMTFTLVVNSWAWDTQSQEAPGAHHQVRTA